MFNTVLLAAILTTASNGGVTLTVSSDSSAIDPAKSVFLTVELVSPTGVKATMPDLRDRLRGFALADDFAEDPKTAKDGSTVQITNWKLVPEPCAKRYGIAPFAVHASPSLLARASDDGKFSFVAGPVRFANPPAREAVTGGMECAPEKDFPPLTWKLVGWLALGLLALAAVVFGVFLLIRYACRRVKEHRMSPIERARVELERLLQKGLPGRGRYKDFYVELTMVVRRYIQRKYGIKAPHMTTEEFLAAFRGADKAPATAREELRNFLESADMVKFAGVKATPEMADSATDSARNYLTRDSQLTTNH